MGLLVFEIVQGARSSQAYEPRAGIDPWHLKNTPDCINWKSPATISAILPKLVFAAVFSSVWMPGHVVNYPNGQFACR